MDRTARGLCPTIGNRGASGRDTRPRPVSAVSCAEGRAVLAGASLPFARSQRQERQGSMVDIVRRRGRGRAAERHQPLGEAAAQYASMGWPVCVGAHTYRGTLAAMERGRACSCDRVGCPAPGAHPTSPAWQMQATVDLSVIRDWWETRPEANVILVTGRVFDVLDVPAVAGAAALERLYAAGVAVGPVAVVGQERMLFFVVTRGSPADEDEWWTSGLDCEPESVVEGLRW